MEKSKTLTNVIPLVDGDIIRYEIGFAAETGWRAITENPEAIPPFDYVENLLNERLQIMMNEIGTKEPPIIFFTEGHTFRFDLATSRPYKGTRIEKKPWHYDNLTVYLRDVLRAQVVTHIEADDAISIMHVNHPEETIICSRDKDLRQVPGWFYSWELGYQPAFGPVYIDKAGSLSLSDDGKNKLTGTGLPFFYSQVLTGDRVDNIPGLPGCGPVAAYNMLKDRGVDEQLDVVRTAYADDEYLLEQGRLCWMTRRLNEDGSPELWEIGMEE